jgi:2-C-methyl-D-erythritol 4-phosphate cytidylyltransferase
MSKSNVSVIMPAAGSGVRLGKNVSKALVLLKDRPIFIWTLRMLQRAYSFHRIIVPAQSNDIEAMKEHVHRFKIKRVIFVEGGKTRAESVKNGLDVLSSQEKIVLVHDMARPFVSKREIEDLILRAKEKGACILALKSTATVKEVNAKNLFIRKTLNRETIYLAQTPQVFNTGLLRRAYGALGRNIYKYTDESSMVEALPRKVYIVEGSSSNIKITSMADLEIAENLIGDNR